MSEETPTKHPVWQAESVYPEKITALRAALQDIVDPEIRANSFDTRKLLRELRTAEMDDAAARQREMAGQISSAFVFAMGIILAAFLLGGIGVWAAQIKPARH